MSTSARNVPHASTDTRAIAILAGDSVFSYIAARELFKAYAITDVYLSNYNSGSASRIRAILKKTSLAYFTYRAWVQILSRLLSKHSIAHEAQKRGIPLTYLHSKQQLGCLATKYCLSIAFNFDIVVPTHYIDNNEVGVLNIHAGNLPTDKGISPVVWAFCRGDQEIWICFYLMDGGIDTGLVLKKTRLAIQQDWSLFRTYCETLMAASRCLVELVGNIETLKAASSTQPFDELRHESYNSWPDPALHTRMRQIRRSYFKLADFAFLRSILE